MDSIENANELRNYDDYASKYNAAFSAFVKIFEMRNPRPVKKEITRDNLFVPIGLVVIMIASVLVSGSRTVDEFGGGGIGASAFIMLEGAIIAYAFFRTRFDFNEERLQDVRKLARRGLMLAFVVAIAANVHSELRRQGVEISELISLGLLLSLAISAPTLALISGDMLAVVTMSNNSKQGKADKEYDLALLEWQTALNTTWEKEKAKWGVRLETVSAPPRQLPEKKVEALPAPQPEPKAPELEPIKNKVGDKTLYTCPLCSRQMTRQAWSTHKCRTIDTSVDRQLTRQAPSSEVIDTSVDHVKRSNGNGNHDGYEV